jgi:hypothetical protein
MTLTSFSVHIIGSYDGYTFPREYKRLDNARKRAVKLSTQFPDRIITIRLNERFTDCCTECSGPFEEYRNGKQTTQFANYLTDGGMML